VPSIGFECFHGLFRLGLGDQDVVSVPAGLSLATEKSLSRHDQPGRHGIDRDSGCLQRCSKVTHHASYSCPKYIQILVKRGRDDLPNSIGPAIFMHLQSPTPLLRNWTWELSVISPTMEISSDVRVTEKNPGSLRSERTFPGSSVEAGSCFTK